MGSGRTLMRPRPSQSSREINVSIHDPLPGRLDYSRPASTAVRRPTRLADARNRSKHPIWCWTLRTHEPNIYGGKERRLHLTHRVAEMTSMHGLRIAAQVIVESGISIDPLPYTADFDVLHARLVERLGVPCSKNEAWCLFIGARKRGLVGPQKRFPKQSKSHSAKPAAM